MENEIRVLEIAFHCIAINRLKDFTFKFTEWWTEKYFEEIFQAFCLTFINHRLQNQKILIFRGCMCCAYFILSKVHTKYNGLWNTRYDNSFATSASTRKSFK